MGIPVPRRSNDSQLRSLSPKWPTICRYPLDMRLRTITSTSNIMALVNIAERTSGITIFFSGKLSMPVPYLGVIPMPESSVIRLSDSDKRDEDIT